MTEADSWNNARAWHNQLLRDVADTCVLTLYCLLVAVLLGTASIMITLIIPAGFAHYLPSVPTLMHFSPLVQIFAVLFVVFILWITMLNRRILYYWIRVNEWSRITFDPRLTLID